MSVSLSAYFTPLSLLASYMSVDITVGYRLSEYKKGSVAVLEPTHLPNTSQSMKDIVLNFQNYVRQSKYEPFDPVSQQGNWMWLLIRTTSLQDIMIMPTFVQQDLSQVSYLLRVTCTLTNIEMNNTIF